MKKVLNKNLEVLIDKEDLHFINEHNWCLNGGYAFSRKYIKDYKTGEKRKYKTIPIFLHRLIINAEPGQIVDHINRNKLDNRRKNLRIVTSLQNNMNRGTARNRKYKGVFWHKNKNKFCSMIGFNNKRIWIGFFQDEISAAKAYDKKAKELYGKYCFLNFP